jgi:hypothetical protein
MVAHASAVRENLFGIRRQRWARVGRALRQVKINAIRSTSCKVHVAADREEYEAFPSKWKVAERIKGWEEAFNPLKERMSGERFRIRKEKATSEQIRESPFVAARLAFGKSDRLKVVETNDRHITRQEWGDSLFWLYQKIPSYGRRREDWIWLEEAPSRDSEPIVWVKYIQ